MAKRGKRSLLKSQGRTSVTNMKSVPKPPRMSAR
jgi:hypothetical protein